MSALGRLVAAVALDTAEFTVGTDRAKYAAAQMAADVDKSLKGLESKVKSALGGIGAAIAGGFAISALKSQFDGYAEGAAKLEELAGKAGMTVEQFSGLNQVAKLSRTSSDDLAGALEKLSRGIAGTDAATSTQTKALDYLGISTRDSSGHLKDAGTITEEVAKKLAGMADGATKTALLMDLYGKAGANLLPTLKDLAEYGTQNAAVTAAQAAAAKGYEQDLVRLGLAKGALVRIISSELLPVADAVVKTFLNMQTQTGGVRDQAQALAEDGSIRAFAMSAVNMIGLVMNAGDGVVRVFKGIGEEIGYLVARTVNSVVSMGKAAYALAAGDLMGAVDAVTQGTAKDNDIVAQHAEALRAIFETPLAGDVFVGKVATNLAAIDQQMKAHAKTVKNAGDGYGAMGDAAVAALVKVAKATADANAAVAQSAAKTTLAQDAAALHTLETAYKLGGVSIADYYTQKAALEQKDINAQVNAETIAFRGFAQELSFLEGLTVKGKAKAAVDAQIATVQKQMAEAADKVNGTLATQSKVTDTLVDGQIAMMNANLAILKPLGDENTKLQEQLDTFGMTTQQIVLFNKAKLEAQLIAIQNVPEYDAEDEAIKRQVNTLTAQIALMNQIANKQGVVDSLTQQKTLWTDLTGAAGQFFGNLVVNGSKAFDSLKSSLKSFAQQIIAFFAQRFLLQMVAGVAGSGSATGIAANAAANGLSNSVTGSIGSAAMSAGSSYLFGTAADAGLILDSGGTAGFATSGVIGSGGFGATVSSGATAAGLTTAEGALTATGWGVVIAAAIAIVAAIASRHKGGPKTGGSYMASFDPNGVASQIQVPGTDNGRFFTPDQYDSQIKPLVAGTDMTYRGTVAALGGKAGAFSFGLGLDNDPNGTAQSRVSSSLLGASGKQIYSQRDMNMDDKDVPAALQLESSRMILAALKASDLPGYLSKVFDGLTPSAATQDQITGAIQTAEALKSIFDITQRDPLKDAADAMSASANALDTVMKSNKATIEGVIAAYDGSATATKNLQQATVGFYNAQMQLILGIEQAKQSIDSLFGTTIRNFKLAGMDGQGKYNFYQSEASGLQQQILNSSDPATIQALSQRLDQDMEAAFNLLTPEQQAGAEGQAFIARASSTDTAIEAHLDAVKQGVIDATTAALDRIEALIGASDAAQTAAANTQQNAANTNLTAAKTPLTLVVQTEGGQQVATFSS